MNLSKRAKRRLLLLAAILIGVAGAYFVINRVQQTQEARLVAQRKADGLAAYAAGDYEKAIDALSYVASKLRNNPDLEVVLAFADARSRVPTPNDRHIPEAIGLYDQARRLDRQNVKALDGMLALYASIGGFDTREAYDTAQDMLQIDPDHVRALEATAVYHFTMREFAPTLRSVRRLQQVDFENTDWFLREVYTHLARFDAVDVAPDVETTDEGESGNDAVRTVDDVLSLCDQWIERARSASASGDRNPEVGRFHYVKAYALLSVGRPDESRAEAVRAADHGVETPDVFSNLIVLLERLGEDAAVDRLVEQTQRRLPDRVWVWEQAVRRPCLRGDIAGAHAAIERAERQFESEISRGGTLDPTILRWKVLAQILAGDARRQAGAADRGHTDAVATLAELERATQNIEDQEERDAMRAWVRAMHAHLHLSRADWAEASVAFEESIRISRNDPVLWFILGDAYRRVGELDHAADAYRNAWQHEPNWTAAGMALGNTLLELGRPHDALNVCIEMEGHRSQVSPVAMVLYVRSWIAMCDAFGGTAETARMTGRTLFNITEQLERLRSQYGLVDAPVIGDLLLQLYRLENNREAIRSIVDETIALGDDAPTELLLYAARASRFADLGREDELIQRAMTRADAHFTVTETRAWLALHDGRIDDGLKIIDEGRSRQVEENREPGAERRWDRLRVLYLAQAGDERAIAQMHALLQDYPDAWEVPGLVLSQSIAWTSRDLIDAAIAAQEEVLGDRGSTRLLLARAMRTMQFDRDNDEQVALALSNVADALRTTPDSLAAMTLMSDALIASRPPRYREAIDYLERAVMRYPGRVDLYPRLVVLHQRVGDHAGARVWLDRMSARRDLSPLLRRTEIMLLEQQGRLDRAIELLSAQINRAGDDLSVDSVTDRLSLAGLHARQGSLAEAERIVDDLLETDPGHELVIRFAAELYSRMGRFEEGEALLQTRPVEGGPGAREARLGAYYRRAGMDERAVASLRRALSLEPRNPDYINELVMTHLRAGRTSEARRIARDGLEHAADHAGLLEHYALACLDGDRAARRDAMTRLRGHDMVNAAILRLLEVYDRVNAESPTSADLRIVSSLVQEHPTFAPGWRLAVSMHIIAGSRARALELAKSAMLNLPADPDPARWAAELAVELEEWSDALEATEAWRLREFSDPIPADLARASIHMRLDEPGAAARAIEPHFEEIMRRGRAARSAGTPQNPDPDEDSIDQGSLTAVQALLLGGRFDEVARAVRSLIPRERAWRNAWIQMLRHVDDRTAVRMIELLEEVLSDGPEDRLVVASTWSQHGRRTGSSEYFERAAVLAHEALQRDPRLAVRVYLMLGTLAEFQGDGERAERHYRAVLADDPRNPFALNNLAYLIAADESRLSQAADLSRLAVEQRPDVSSFLDTYAVILYRLGRLEEALQHANKAAELDPASAEAQLTLSEILSASGRRERALAHLDEAERLLEAAPSFDRSSEQRAATIRERLDELNTREGETSAESTARSNES